MKSTLLKAAIAVSTIISLGSPAAMAAQVNKKAKVNALATTTVFATQTSFAVNSQNIGQSAIGPSNQNAVVIGGASSTAFQNVSAGASNVVVVNQ